MGEAVSAQALWSQRVSLVHAKKGVKEIFRVKRKNAPPPNRVRSLDSSGTEYFSLLLFCTYFYESADFPILTEAPLGARRLGT